MARTVEDLKKIKAAKRLAAVKAGKKEKMRQADVPYHPLNVFLAEEFSAQSNAIELLRLDSTSLKKQVRQCEKVIERQSRLIRVRERDLMAVQRGSVLAMEQSRIWEDVCRTLHRVGEQMASQNKVLKAAYKLRSGTMTPTHRLCKAYLDAAGMLSEDDWPATMDVYEQEARTRHVALEVVEEDVDTDLEDEI